MTKIKTSSVVSEKSKELSNRLYNHGNYQRAEKKKLSKSLDSKRKQEFNQVHIEKNSNELFENMKREKFNKIFNLLDGDEDGKISFTSMETKNLTKTIRTLLDPVFRQIKFEQDSLNRMEFIKILHRIYNVVD